ncbi:MAG: T9SS type A sorting domain-containing protein [Bacteroidota bacterium]
MKKFYLMTKLLLAVFAVLFALTANSQTLEITLGDTILDPGGKLTPTAEYHDTSGVLVDVNIKWHTEPGYLGKVRNGELTAEHPGEGYLIAKYQELRDTVNLTVTGTPKGDKDEDDGDDEGEDEDDYPKVKIIPGSIKVAVGDSVELRAFYVDSTDTKIDTTFTWSVEPVDLGEFPDPMVSMFHAGDDPGKGTIIATLGDLADTIKVTLFVPKVKKDKDNNKGKQLTIMPGDTMVYTGAGPIQYSATYKTNGNKHQGAEFIWSVSDTSVAKIDADGLLTLAGNTGMALVSAEYSNFKASVELLVVDSTVDLDVNTITLHRVLPDGKELKAKTIKEGESYKIGGLPYPLNILNAGMLHFPYGCIDEDITIYMFIPEEYAEMNDDSTDVTFSDDIITGVKFSVKPAGSDTIVEPYWFNDSIILSVVYKKELLDSLGVTPEELDVFFADNTGFVTDGAGKLAVDTVKNKLYAAIEHFSTIVVRQGEAKTSVKDLTPVNGDEMSIYPNPFNTSATIQFRLEEQGDVNITVYNLFGQKIQMLVNGEYPEGLHKVSWKGNDQNGAPATSGIYICRMIKDGKVAQVKRIILNR